MRILKLAAIGISLLAAGGLLWMVLREPKERTSQAENRSQSMTASPKPAPQAQASTSSPASTDNFTGLGLWQPTIVGPAPFAEEEPEAATLMTPPEDLAATTPSLITPPDASAGATPSQPPAEVTEGGRSGPASAPESQGHPFPPGGTHQAPHYHHQSTQGFRSLEALKNAAAAVRERDALQSQLKELEAKLQMTQKSVDILATERDELQRELEESEARAQTAQKDADIAASERDALRNQLKEIENRAITAEKNGELATGQLNALQSKLEESEAKARAAQNDGDVARSQREALQSQLAETEAEAQTAKKNADLAGHQLNALTDQLKNAQEKNAQLAQHHADLAGSHNSESKPQSRKEPAKSVNALADLAVNPPPQPPNPGQNAKPAPLTQELDSAAPPGPP